MSPVYGKFEPITDWERTSNSQPLNIHPSEKMKQNPQNQSPYDYTPAQPLQKDKLYLYLETDF